MVSAGFSRVGDGAPDFVTLSKRFGARCPFRRPNRFQGRTRPYEEKRTLPGTVGDVTRSVRVTAPPPLREGGEATLRFRVRELTPGSLSTGVGRLQGWRRLEQGALP